MCHVCWFICYLCVELKLMINTRSLSNQALKSAHPSRLNSRCWPWGVFIGAGQPLQHGEVRDTNLAWVRPVNGRIIGNQCTWSNVNFCVTCNFYHIAHKINFPQVSKSEVWYDFAYLFLSLVCNTVGNHRMCKPATNTHWVIMLMNSSDTYHALYNLNRDKERFRPYKVPTRSMSFFMFPVSFVNHPIVIDLPYQVGRRIQGFKSRYVHLYW